MDGDLENRECLLPGHVLKETSIGWICAHSQVYRDSAIWELDLKDEHASPTSL
jgi:hypothetical protein